MKEVLDFVPVCSTTSGPRAALIQGNCSQIVLTPSLTADKASGLATQRAESKWRKRVGVEPTGDGIARRPPVLKTGTITGPHALPRALQTNATERPDLHSALELCLSVKIRANPWPILLCYRFTAVASRPAGTA